MVGILAISFLVFRAISIQVQQQRIDPTFDRMDELQLDSARKAYERHGKEALRENMERLNHYFVSSHYFLDQNGIDVLTGENRSELLPPQPATKSRIRRGGYWIITHQSQDGKYWFAAVGHTSRPYFLTFLPYYFLVIGTSGALFWLAVVGVIIPLRKIASTISEFGSGNLSVRVRTGRPDEIGQLGRSFNQMADRLQRLISSERRLLGDISHELRSPLARLKFAIKLARTSSDTRAALDRIERDVDRISSLVADIVEITFVEGDPALRGRETVSLGEIARDIIRDCSVEADFRGCRIEICNGFEGQVVGSRELLRRALENVVRNAIRHSPEQATVQISLAREDQNAVIDIRDEGPGVPEDALEHIFDPFFRVEEARDTTSGGIGLGLSIAKRAVQAHHGTIRAENASPGLRVRIAIPLVTEPVAQEQGA